jgi:hypothetical protein
MSIIMGSSRPDASTRDGDRTVRRWWRYNGSLAQLRVKAAAGHPLGRRSGGGQS